MLSPIVAWRSTSCCLMPALVEKRKKRSRRFDYMVGTNIRYLRIEHLITQHDLARAADISNSQLSRIENGERALSLQQALAISDALGEPVDRLIRPIKGLRSAA